MTGEIMSDFMELLNFSFDSLCKEIAEIQNNWVDYLNDESETYKEKLLECQKNLGKQEAEYDAVNDVAENLKVTRNTLSSLKQEEINLQSQIEMLKKQNESMLETVKERSEELNRERDTLESQRQMIEEKQIGIRASSELFSKHLGLEIRTLKGNRMQFIFKNMDPEKTDIQAFIIIGLNNRIYSVEESFPMLPNLESLQKVLNDTNNLAGFIQYSRMLLKQALGHKS